MHLDDALVAILLRVEATMANLLEGGDHRKRGGSARGTYWLEISGREAGNDGGWVELRVTHDPIKTTVTAALVLYQPLTRGGRTIHVGGAAHDYVAHPSEVEDRVVANIERWVRLLRDEEGRTA